MPRLVLLREGGCDVVLRSRGHMLSDGLRVWFVILSVSVASPSIPVHLMHFSSSNGSRSLRYNRDGLIVVEYEVDDMYWI